MTLSDSDSEITKTPRSSSKKLGIGQTKFTQKTKELKLLKKLFDDGDISATDRPADIRLKHPSFQKYTVTQFWSQFNNLRRKIGVVSKEGYRAAMKQQEGTCNPDQILTDGLAPLLITGGKMEETDELSTSTAEDCPLVWVPKKIITEWQNKDGVRCITLIFQLTGGSAEQNSDGVEVKVTESGTELAISEVWSNLMAEIDAFYTLFPKTDDETADEFNRRKYAMEDNVRSMKDDNNMLHSVYRMPLPFRVDPTVRRVRILGTSDGCRFCYVDLAERQRKMVESVIMIDKGKSRKLSPGSEKAQYSSLY